MFLVTTYSSNWRNGLLFRRGVSYVSTHQHGFVQHITHRDRAKTYAKPTIRGGWVVFRLCWFYHCFLFRFVFFKAPSDYCQQINILSPTIVTQTTYHLKMFFSVRKYIVEPSNRIRTICSGQDSSRDVWFNGCVYPCSKTKKSINGRTHSTCPNTVLSPVLLQYNKTLALFAIKSNN